MLQRAIEIGVTPDLEGEVHFRGIKGNQRGFRNSTFDDIVDEMFADCLTGAFRQSCERV